MATEVTRRTVLGTAGGLLGAAVSLRVPQALGATPQIMLRLLETSDLHMFVLDWDYYRVKTDPTVGLAKVASLIRAARAESPNNMLFDNGDFLQGNPLADYIAEQAQPQPGAAHPIVSIMGQLGYDAVGLGNHEFNYGLEFLQKSLATADFPFVCANVTRVGGAAFLPATAVIEKKVKDSAGVEHTLRVGVIGFVPPQIMDWDQARLEGLLEARDIVLAAKQHMPALRAQCDIVVALCHSGVGNEPFVEGVENAGLHLASVPGLDVIMLGHSHRVFPGKDYDGQEGVDIVAGRLRGVPAVMPGFWGSHLGVVDLTLERQGDKWVTVGAAVETRAISKRSQEEPGSLVERDAVVAAAIAPVHQATLAWVEQPVGVIDGPIHSYFVWAGYDPTTALINEAQTWYARPLLAAAGVGDIPVLSAAAPFRAGYTPDSFIDIAKGPVALRHAADLYVYSNNTVVGLELTGEQVVDWLEFVSRIFQTIEPGRVDPQQLLDQRRPSYSFDVISGLSYAIDVTKPGRYDAAGERTKAARRVVNVEFDGQPIDAARRFIVLTNNYRADGGGNVPALKGAKAVLRAPDTNREALVRYFKSAASTKVPVTFPWSFLPVGKPSIAYFDTGISASQHSEELKSLSLVGEGRPGYLRAHLSLF